MSKWSATRFPGVRYREHPTRKIKSGIQKDRYFAIRYQRNGKRKEEGLGWASEGWNAEAAANELHELKKNYERGEGPIRLAEKKELAEQERTFTEEKKIQTEKDALTFKQFFKENYLPIAIADKKPESMHTEKIYFEKWIDPIIGENSFQEIAPIHVQKIKQRLQKAKRAPRTIEYVFAIIRQVWHQAQRDGFTESPSPTKQVTLPKINNKRLRFLSHTEADGLVSEIKARSEQLYQICLISLHCGLRAKEIFTIVWGSVDLGRGIINVVGKGEKSRPAFMTQEIKALFSDLQPGAPSELVFKDRSGKRIVRVSGAFQRAVDKLNLNDGVVDRRQKIVFHSLRHTFASWHVESGTDLYAVQKLMGHASFQMVERYSHLSNGTLQKAVKRFESAIQKLRVDNDPKKEGEVITI